MSERVGVIASCFDLFHSGHVLALYDAKENCDRLVVTQYDVEIFAKYKSDNLNIDVFPAATVTKGLGDLERVISNLRPSITETTVNQSVRSGGGRGNAFISADSGDFIVQ